MMMDPALLERLFAKGKEAEAGGGLGDDSEFVEYHLYLDGVESSNDPGGWRGLLDGWVGLSAPGFVSRAARHKSNESILHVHSHKRASSRPPPPWCLM